MWTLLIASMVFATADEMEVKVTRYAEYATAMECQQAWYAVTSEFTQDEVAWCEGPTARGYKEIANTVLK